MSWQQLREGSMRRKRHEPIPPQDLDKPFGPPPIEYLYRCSSCGELMWGLAWQNSNANTMRGLCPKWDVQDVMATQWSMSIQSPSPPVGRYVQALTGAVAPEVSSPPQLPQ